MGDHLLSIIICDQVEFDVMAATDIAVTVRRLHRMAQAVNRIDTRTKKDTFPTIH
jgi:hypothetical protein